MAKDSSTTNSVLHLQTDKTGGSAVPASGILDSGSRKAKMEVCDSGIETFPDTTPSGAGASATGGGITTAKKGFKRLAITVANGSNITKSLDEWYMDSLSVTTMIPLVWKRSVTLLADAANSESVWVGDEATDENASVGFPLSAGQSLNLEITRGSNIYLGFKNSSGGAVTLYVYWIAV